MIGRYLLTNVRMSETLSMPIHWLFFARRCHQARKVEKSSRRFMILAYTYYIGTCPVPAVPRDLTRTLERGGGQILPSPHVFCECLSKYSFDRRDFFNTCPK